MATEIHDYILDGTNILKELVTDTGGCPKYPNEYLYYDFQKYIKKQQKITIAINKRFFKISFSIVVGTSVLQLLLKLLLGLI